MRFWRGRISLFLLVCPRRIFDNQRVTQTEKGSDLTIYAAPFFVSRRHNVRFFFPLFGLIFKDLLIFREMASASIPISHREGFIESHKIG